MPFGLIEGSATRKRINTGISVLELSSLFGGIDVTLASATNFTLGALGTTTLQIMMRLAGNHRDVCFNLQLFNATTGSVVAQHMAASGAFNFGESSTYVLPVTVTNVAHEYQIRLEVFNANSPNFLQLYSPNFQCIVNSGSGGGGGGPEYRNAIIDGGGGLLVAGNEVVYSINEAKTITGVRLIGDVSGDLNVEFERSPFGTYPGGLVSLTGSSGVVLSGAQTIEDTTLAGWTTALLAGDVIRAVVSGPPAPASITRVVTALLLS